MSKHLYHTLLLLLHFHSLQRIACLRPWLTPNLSLTCSPVCFSVCQYTKAAVDYLIPICFLFKIISNVHFNPLANGLLADHVGGAGAGGGGVLAMLGHRLRAVLDGGDVHYGVTDSPRHLARGRHRHPLAGFHRVGGAHRVGGRGHCYGQGSSHWRHHCAVMSHKDGSNQWRHQRRHIPRVRLFSA